MLNMSFRFELIAYKIDDIDMALQNSKIFSDMYNKEVITWKSTKYSLLFQLL